MSDSIQAVQRDIAETRARMEATAAELHEVVADEVHRTEQKVDPRTYVRQYPWPALALALGAGIAIAVTGAERKAAVASVEGAKKAGKAIGDGAVAAKDAIVEKVKGGDELPEPVEMHPVVDGQEERTGIRAKIRGAVDDLLHTGLQEILNALGPAAQQAQTSVGAVGPSSPVSSESVASADNLAS
jgi:hypothetical protein